MGKRKKVPDRIQNQKAKRGASLNSQEKVRKWIRSNTHFLVPVLAVLASLLFLQANSLQQLAIGIYRQAFGDTISHVGGWKLPSARILDMYDTYTCDIDRRFADEITSDEFHNAYLYKKPLMITFRNGASDWTEPSMWTVNSLKSAYGQWSVMSGNSRDIVRKGGSGDVDTSFGKFVEEMAKEEGSSEPHYLFDREFYNSSGLPEILHPPPFLAIKDNLDDSIFFLGTSGSGVSFHQHADAWNGVVYGRKRWFLYPVETTPPGGVYPGFTQLEWYNMVYPNLTPRKKPLECVQEAGEILYLPESIYHGTINIGDTIAVGIQKKVSVTRIGKLFYEYGELEKEPQTLNVKRRIKDIFKELLEILPGSTEAMMKLGSAYQNLGQYSTALPLLQKAVHEDPYFILAWLELAKVQEQLGDITSAESSYKQAMMYNSTLWDIFAFRGDFLLRQGRPEEAATMYKKGISVKPDMVTFWKMLKVAQEKMGDQKGARISQDWIDFLSM